MAEPTVPPRDQRTGPITPVGDQEDPTRRRSRRGPDALTLVAGLITLAFAGIALTGRTPDLSLLDLRWALAAAAVLLGLALLSASAGGAARSRRRPGPVSDRSDSDR